jgi:thiamine-phosphate pyrophosphorylase
MIAPATGLVDASLNRFYPIVPDVAWLQRIVPLGIKTVQLRLKDADPPRIMGEILEAKALCRQHGVQLIVNDYWRESIAAGCDYIHLGQEDLAAADLPTLKAAGLKFGVSTHDEAELAVALAANPDYIALGPIFETKLKAMVWAPQGIAKLTLWRQKIDASCVLKNSPPIPLVAIGGLTFDRASDALAAGAQSAAVITDFIGHADPEARVVAWVAWSKTLG